MTTSPSKDVLAAGVVTFRPGKRVLLVHRPKYDDWSFPKGKLDRGEHPTAAAVREVSEETGVHVRLGPQLTSQRYSTGSRMKTVHYWTGRAVGSDDVSGYLPNEEIDEVRWLPVSQAMEILSYPHDRDTLAEAMALRRRTRALVIVRHSAARSRKAWRGDDTERPLLRTGALQAERLVPALAAYDVTRVLSSPSARCVETVTPYADTTGWELETTSALSEEHATRKRVRRLLDAMVADLTEHDRGGMVCTHRPVLPHVFEGLGLDVVALEPGEMVVVHLRQGVALTTERHLVR